MASWTRVRLLSGQRPAPKSTLHTNGYGRSSSACEIPEDGRAVGKLHQLFDDVPGLFQLVAALGVFARRKLDHPHVAILSIAIPCDAHRGRRARTLPVAPLAFERANLVNTCGLNSISRTNRVGHRCGSLPSRSPELSPSFPHRPDPRVCVTFGVVTVTPLARRRSPAGNASVRRIANQHGPGDGSVPRNPGRTLVFVPIRGHFTMDLQSPDEETMVRVAVAELDDRFSAVDHARIESTVRRLVHDWSARSRVQAFVGIIAERHARSEIEKFEKRGEKQVVGSA